MPSQPSQYSYGWASAFPLTALTVSSTARAHNLSNQPDTDAHNRNIGLLSDFLAKIPFEFRVNSGYRSYAVNTKVGGASSSQHMKGLAADISPLRISNKSLAAWLYKYRADFPELDQVIWYSDTTHVHVGICPPGAWGCASSRWEAGGTVKMHANGVAKAPEFFSAWKEGSHYYPWAPSPTELASQAAFFNANRPLGTGMALNVAYIAATGVGALVGLALVWKFKDRSR